MVRMFRTRLGEAMQRAGMNRSQLAQRAGVDRSTLSQLLSADEMRMPRADTVAAIARVLQVSVDWLLGLSGEIRGGAAILAASLQIAPRSRSEVDENLQHWHEEAVGYKIRYVPSSLPDLAKTERVLQHEFAVDVAKTPDQAIAATEGKLAYSRLPETDMEICVSRQTIEGFAHAENIWKKLDIDARVEQLERLITLTEELYPGLRLYLYDGLSHFSAPYTIFGTLRAAIFVGQMYFVFNTIEHVRVLTRHFDDLIRAAVVQAHETPEFLTTLRNTIHT